MLGVLSDLHVQHTGLDTLRYRDENDVVRQIGVRRNISAPALDRFFGMLDHEKERHRSTAVQLVLAGDIFELLRTPLWFEGEHALVRPVDDLGTDAGTNRLRSAVSDVLEAVAKENEVFWQCFRDHVRQREINVHYIPGNHDRLANAWPSVRRRIREILGMPPAGTPFPVKKDFPHYGVRVRHGQEYDRMNMRHAVARGAALDLTYKEHLKPCFGDYITIDVAARLAAAFRIRYAREMRRPGGQALRNLYLDLTEFDDVRPSSKLVDYLLQHMRADKKATFKRLKPVLRDVVETAAASSFFVAEAKRLKLMGPAKLRALREAVKTLSPETLVSLLSNFVGEGDGSGPADVARFEPNLGERLDVVIAGHTHRPDLVSMPQATRDRPAFYLDSGTWRTTILQGLETFGRLRAYTMIFCFDEAERTRVDARRFATWTGHLSSGKSGAYDEVARDLSSAPKDAMLLRFVDIEVHRIEDEWWGAELVLHFGVDGAGGRHTWKKVEAGQRLAFPSMTFPLDPDLDGELWCFGWEEDYGNFIFDKDDILPWATGRLARVQGETEASGGHEQFAEQTGTLVLRGLNNTDLTIRFVVEAAE